MTSLAVDTAGSSANCNISFGVFTEVLAYLFIASVSKDSLTNGTCHAVLNTLTATRCFNERVDLVDVGKLFSTSLHSTIGVDVARDWLAQKVRDERVLDGTHHRYPVYI